MVQVRRKPLSLSLSSSPHRISTLLTVLSVAVLGAASLFAYVGHCTRGAKMLTASGLYAIGGKRVLKALQQIQLSRLSMARREESKGLREHK